MEMRIEVDSIEDVRRRLGILSHKAPSVVANAINRTTTNIKKTMAQQTARHYNVTAGDVKKTITISKATRARMQGATISKASPIALAKFKVSPNRKVTYGRGGKPSPKVYKVSVKKGPASKPLDADPKSFIAVMKSGHQGLFQRRTDKSLPIKQLFGPSVPQMIKNDESMRNIEQEAKSTLQKRIDAEIENILRKGNT